MQYQEYTALANLTRDPETRFSSDQKPIVNFGIAINYGSGDKRETLFWNCTAFGKTAEFVQANLTKGTPVLVVGRVVEDTWEDKNTGQTRKEKKLIVNTVQGLGKTNGNGSAPDASFDPPKFE